MKNKVISFCLSAILITACHPQGQNSTLMDTTTDAFGERAKQAALELYLANAGVIQGSDPDAVVVLESENTEKATFEVTIDDGNEHGETWTVRSWVDIRKDSGTVREIRNQTAGTVDSPVPTDTTSWNALAVEVAMKLYLDNAGVIQGGDPEAGAVQLVSSNAKTSTYSLVISDGNDEGEVWDVIYTVRMANASPFVLRVTESFPVAADGQ